MIITIDGPSASGKSTIAQSIARELNLYYISSGLLFRALAYFLIKNYQYKPAQVNQAHESEINDFLKADRLKYTYDNAQAHVFLDGIDITSMLKSSDLDTGASVVATNPMARQILLIFQRTFAQSHPTIIEGRDCGSVVFPHADVKFFLTAKLEVRAQRWQHLQALRSNNVSLQEAIAFVAARDKRDTERTLDPLIIPDDAHIIDNSAMDISQTVEAIIAIITKKRKKKRKLFITSSFFNS